MVLRCHEEAPIGGAPLGEALRVDERRDSGPSSTPKDTSTRNHWSEKQGLRRFWWTSDLVQTKGRAVWLQSASKQLSLSLSLSLGLARAGWTFVKTAAAPIDPRIAPWRFLRAHKIDLSGRKSWCVSNDPEFAAKAAEIVGLYMAPPGSLARRSRPMFRTPTSM
jgi:hypothetical protein